ncbi:hypothetical protein IJ135_02860 [Candidatus Saccharibacteria bacterium]|nr:hypothetical protein [Candidatus Saccharibacteria bacterium]
MLKLFYGDDRVRAMQEVTKLLGQDHEVIDGADITLSDLPSIFLGTSLLSSSRKILIRDFTENRPAAAELGKYLQTPHDIILLESKLDKRGNFYKENKDNLEIREFKLPEANFGAVFDIYRTAKRDGARAIKMLKDIEPTEEPAMFVGVMVSQALKDFAAHPGVRERRALKELSVIDIQMKSSGVEPWLLIEGFLLRLSHFWAIV